MDKKIFRNTRVVVEKSNLNYKDAIHRGLMQNSFVNREGKLLTLKDGSKVVEFINCSYLGLDLHPKIQSAYRNLEEFWGVNFCCARSRLTMDPLIELEEKLSMWLKGRVVTFPSVTSTHMAVMPLVASGQLFFKHKYYQTRLIFDKLAHSSMQYLKPVLAQEAKIVTISHNSIDELITQVKLAKAENEIPVFIADGIYSMGGVAPIKNLLKLADEYDFYLYIDDAHGTSIVGKNGIGTVLSQYPDGCPERLILTFSMSKGFGAYGGGVLLANRHQESTVRTYSQIYAFSAPLDFTAVPACHAALELHQNGEVEKLQKILSKNMMYFDSHFIENPSEENLSPIRMINCGEASAAMNLCDDLKQNGCLTSVVFFPVVSQKNAQIRISIAANHTIEQIDGLISAIKKSLMKNDNINQSMLG